MKRFIQLLGITLGMLLPVVALAVSETVTIGEGLTKIEVPDLSLSYTIGALTRGLASFQVNAGSIVFTVNRGANIQLTSADKSSFTVTGSSCSAPDLTCGSSSSEIIVQCGDPNVSDGSTLTITPGAASTCSSGSGAAPSGPSGGGGGGPGPGAARPATTATPTPTATVAPTRTTAPTATPLALKPSTPVVTKPVSALPVSDPAYVFKRTLTVGSKGEDVRQLHLKLMELGYYPSSAKVTDKFDKVTTAAVKKFQKANKISAVGYVGEGTRKALNPPPAPPVMNANYVFNASLSSGAKGSAVQQLQLRLQWLGYYGDATAITGAYDKATMAAVKAFQKENKITQNGVLGPATRKALNSAR